MRPIDLANRAPGHVLSLISASASLLAGIESLDGLASLMEWASDQHSFPVAPTDDARHTAPGQVLRPDIRRLAEHFSKFGHVGLLLIACPRIDGGQLTFH